MEQVTSHQERRPTGIRPGSHLFNIYTSDLLATVSRNYAHANDLAIMYAVGDWQTVEGIFSKDMANVSEYLQTWTLQLGTTKEVLAVEPLPESLQ